MSAFKKARKTMKRVASQSQTHQSTGLASSNQSVRAAQEEFVSFLHSQQARLEKLDPVVDAEFVLAVQILLRTGKPQRVVADKLGVNPATISRWAAGEKLPVRPLLRDAYVREMRAAMPSLIDA